MDRPRDRRTTLISFTVFCLVAFGWLAFLLHKGGLGPQFDGEHYAVRVLVPTTSNLTSGSRVTMAGIRVGRVEAIERADIGARVDLKLNDSEVFPLPADSRVRLRQRTPIGENYISIIPGGSSKTIPDGGTIAMDAAEEYVDVDQILSTVRGKTRRTARQTIQGLGQALDGRGDDLNRLVDAGNDFSPPGGKLVSVIYRDREVTSRLVSQLGDIAASIGERGKAIDTIASRGLVGMQAIADRDAALAATLDELPPTLDDVKDITDTIGTVSDTAIPVARNLTAATVDLRPAIDNLRSGALAGRDVLRAAGAASPGLRDTFDEATDLSKVLPAVMPRLRKTFCEIDPMVRYMDPYFPEALHILVGLGSASNSYDATGHLIRLAPIFSDNSAAGLPDNIQQAGSTLLHSGLIGELSGSSLNFDPYPKPGDLGTAQASGSEPIGPERVGDSGYVYPRVKADC